MLARRPYTVAGSEESSMKIMGRMRALVFLLGFLFLPLLTTQAQPAAPPALREKIDTIARNALASTGVPSASIAAVQNGAITYLQAYGDGRLAPRTPATPGMRYSIGSISKQFTATAVLLLAEQGKLSLDDPVSRFVPNLTRGNEVTIRQLLSHTSGYQDYWPQDYVPLIVEEASGVPLLQFLSQHIFAPLGMKSVMNIDQERLTETDATGYLRYALGPPRIAPKEGKGWLFAAGELAMPAEDLAKWDISLINQTVLKPASYRQMETEVVLKNGLGTHYGLSVAVRQELGLRAIEHGGEVSGFTAHNLVFPDARVAVVVLTNQDSVDASGDIARKVAALLFREADAGKQEDQAREVFSALQQGKINRALFTDNCNNYFSEQALKDFASSLGPLGAPTDFTQTMKQERGGMTFRLFEAHFPQKTVGVWERVMPDGKIEQYQVSAK